MDIHAVVHFILFVAYLAAVFYVPSAFRALIRLNLSTILFGASFLFFSGLTYLALATGHEDSTLFVVSDYLQVVSIVGFLFCLAHDLQTALRNLRLAFRAIQAEFGADGNRMIALVTQALRRGR